MKKSCQETSKPQNCTKYKIPHLRIFKLDQELQTVPWTEKPSKSSLEMQAVHTCVHIGFFALYPCVHLMHVCYCVLVTSACVCLYLDTCVIDADSLVKILIVLKQ